MPCNDSELVRISNEKRREYLPTIIISLSNPKIRGLVVCLDINKNIIDAKAFSAETITI